MTIAHGANAIVYFRWRQCRWGDEQFSDGLLPHSGQENRFYHELSRLGNELKQIGEAIESTQPHAEAAIAYNYESRWGIETAKINKALDPAREAAKYHQALAQRVTAIDAIDPREDFSSYSLLIMPRLWMVNKALAKRLTDYVSNGGILCLTAGTGVVDEYGKAFDTPRPGLLTNLAGITVSDFACDNDLIFRLESPETSKLGQLAGSSVADEIHPERAEVIASHNSGWRSGLPAITRNRMGKAK